MQEFRAIEDSSSSVFAIGSSLFRVEDLCRSLEEFLRSQVQTGLNSKLNADGQPPIRNQWLIGGGVAGQMMSPTSNGWSQGQVKIRVTVEFASNEAISDDLSSLEQPSVLDEIRSEGVI